MRAIEPPATLTGSPADDDARTPGVVQLTLSGPRTRIFGGKLAPVSRTQRFPAGQSQQQEHTYRPLWCLPREVGNACRPMLPSTLEDPS